MIGILYGVGVGCGDPQDMTLKAIKTIENADIIAVPQSSKDADLVALSIAKEVCNIKDKEILLLDMPMIRNEEKLLECHKTASKTLENLLLTGKNIAFLTLGDPTVYSTYMYVDEIIKENGFETKIISGITSFTAAASKKGVALCKREEALLIIPASYDGLEDALNVKGTKVLMKTGKKINHVKEILKEKNHYENAYMVERCGMIGEKIYDNLDDVTEKSAYFSVIITKENE